jgi:hypothetical protein
MMPAMALSDQHLSAAMALVRLRGHRSAVVSRASVTFRVVGRSLWGGAAVICALTVFATGCGTSRAPEATTSIVAGAEAQLAQAKTFRVQYSATAGPGAPTNQTGYISAHGEAEYDRHLVDLTMHAVENGKTIFDGELISGGTVEYLRGGLFSKPGKPWFEYTGLPASGPLGASSLFGDPTAVLHQLRATLHGALVPAGHDNIRGVATTHYRVTPEEIARQGATPITDLWVDAQGRLQRLRGEDRENGRTPIFIQTLDLYDYGAPIHITVPPANQVNVGHYMSSTVAQP